MLCNRCNYLRLLCRKSSTVTKPAHKLGTTEKQAREEIIKSSVYMPGDKARLFVSVVKPNINVQKLLADVEKNLKQRRMTADVTLLKNGWKQLSELQTQYQDMKLEKKRLLDILKNNNDSKVMEDFEKINEKFNEVTRAIYQLENDVMIPILHLPNELHQSTPLEDDSVIYEFLSPPKYNFTPKSHIEIGQVKNEIIFANVSPTSYYLTGNAAMFERSCINHFSDIFEKFNFVQISNPDFCKPPLVESCGSGFLDPNQKFIVKTEEVGTGLQLLGGASFESCYGYVMRRNLQIRKHFPLKYFTVGPHYDVNFDPSFGLFKSIQSSRIYFFIATGSDAESDNEYEKSIEVMTETYKKFGMHFRVVNLSAHKLNFTQKLKTSFQLWSPGFNEYVEIGHVSQCGDFVSRRLMAQYEDGDEKKYMNVVHGVGLNLPRFMGCFVETRQDSNGNWCLPVEFEFIS